MNKYNAVQLIKKYKKLSQLLNLTEDENLLNEIILFINDEKNIDTIGQNATKKAMYGEDDFKQVICQKIVDISKLEIDQQILLNKDNIIDYWYSLSDEEKNHYTIFELNIILFLISSQYNKYQKKDKKKVLAIINSVVRDKRMDSSYSNIVV